jgi:hypothetical protein
MVDGMVILRERSLPIYHLGDAFKNQTGTIYVDQIHYLIDSAGESPGNHRRAAGGKLGPATEALKPSINAKAVFPALGIELGSGRQAKDSPAGKTAPVSQILTLASPSMRMGGCTAAPHPAV